MSQHQPHPANVDGDFYVEESCCTLCEIPFLEAPTLFGITDEGESAQCFVKRQPSSDAEWERMFVAVTCSEFECIRYRGTDREFQRRLVDSDSGQLCDNLLADLETLRAQRANRRQPLLKRIVDWIRRL